MAVQAFKFYNKFKEYFADNTIDMDGTTFDMHLYQSASDFATATQSTLGELSGQVASGNGYSQSGKAMTVTWSIGASASEMRFDATAVIWTATGGNIANIKAAVIVARTQDSGKNTGNKLVCYASLTSTQFTVNTGNTLTLTPPAGGIFELN